MQKTNGETGVNHQKRTGGAAKAASQPRQDEQMMSGDVHSIAGAAYSAAPNLNELPQLEESLLNEQQLRALLSDVATYGRVLEATVKANARSQPAAAARLPELYLNLVERRVFGAQLRYEYKRSVWLDTLIPTKDGVRLVRIEFDT